MKAIANLIKKHINWTKDDLRFASIKYAAETGSITGSLYLAIEEIAKEYAANNLPSSLPSGEGVDVEALRDQIAVVSTELMGNLQIHKWWDYGDFEDIRDKDAVGSDIADAVMEIISGFSAHGSGSSNLEKELVIRKQIHDMVSGVNPDVTIDTIIENFKGERGYNEVKCLSCGCNKYKTHSDYNECINCFQKFVIEEGEVHNIEN